MSVNLVFQLGNLSRDPELRHTSAGTPVCNGSIATNRSVPKDGGFTDEVTYVEFTIWGKRAEAFVKYHSKGSRAYLQGRLTLETWEDRGTGKQRSKLKMTAEQWEFVGKGGQSIGRPSGEEAYDGIEHDDPPF